MSLGERVRRSVPYFGCPVLAVAILPAAVLAAFSAPGAGTVQAWLGIFLFAAGVLLAGWAAVAIFRGGSDPTLEPPQELVDDGPYAFTRNPMYVSVLAMVLGEALFFSSVALAAYAAVLFVFFHFFIIRRVEEPRAEEALGEEYGEYCERVPRWLF